jgi:NitT/TauT family transport system permease protein
MSAVARRRLLSLVGVVGALAVWEVAARLNVINTTLTSSPTAFLAEGLAEIERGSLWSQLLTSLVEFLSGITLAIVVGVPIGVIGGTHRRFREIINPWLTILNSTPLVALVPLLIFAFGIGVEVKAIVVFFFAVFSIAVNTLTGVQATGNVYLRVARMFGASEWLTLRTVIIPGTVPYMLTGIRVAGGRGLVGMIVAEFMAGSSGIGYVMNLAASTYNAALLMFLLAVLGIAGVAYSAMLRRLEQGVDQWRPSAQRL